MNELEFGIVISADRLGNWRNTVNIVSIYNNLGVKKATDKMREVIGKIQETGDKVVILGDWNARIGEETGGVEMDTNLGEDEGSVIDYIIESEGIGDSDIKDIEVVTRTESDHFPVTFKIAEKGELGKGARKNTRRKRGQREGTEMEGQQVPYRLVWDDSKGKEYRENMEEIGKEIITENEGEWEDKWDRQIENIKKEQKGLA